MFLLPGWMILAADSSPGGSQGPERLIDVLSDTRLLTHRASVQMNSVKMSHQSGRLKQSCK